MAAEARHRRVAWARMDPIEHHPRDLDALERAYALLESPSVVAKLTNIVGKPLESTLDKLPQGASRRIHAAVRGALATSVRVALSSLRDDPKASASTRSHTWLSAASGAAGGFFGFAGAVALAGALAVVLTSFRATRFLGEPERYAEAVAPWAALSGAQVLFAWGGLTPLAVLVGVFLLVDLLQLVASKLLLNYVSGNDVGLAEVESAVARELGDGTRFSSNNEHFTKMLMKNPWRFAYCLAAGQDYAGLKMQQIFSAFPMVRREACERIAATYRVNACLLDRKLYDTLFDERPASLRGLRTAFESARFRLLILDWADAPA